MVGQKVQNRKHLFEITILYNELLNMLYKLTAAV